LIALVLNTLMPWGLFFSYVLDQLRAALARRAPVWLDTWYELEALSALANFAYLNPDCTFPQLHTSPAEPGFAAHGIAHPLLATADKVRNDFTFAQLGSIVILTGSNMAGKSTFLKALGVNLALAYAGGVVDAHQLDTILFRLFTCIKVSDSVTNGVSYFYAEVQRLKALLTVLETPHPLPLFFAIDEIFRGTNNRERLLGSRAYIHALINQRGVGLIATHDLELVKLADTLPAIRNYHFRDDIVAGRMVFDYLLRPGPSPTTNALKIMHSAGLPIDEEGVVFDR
jgi:DNA mismatch repair ATPase MutS